MGDDRHGGDDAQFRAFHEGGGNQDAIDEVVKGIADQDEQAGAAVIMGRRMRFVSLAMVVVAMPPQHQLFENEEHQDADQHRAGHVVGIGMLERVRQDF